MKKLFAVLSLLVFTASVASAAERGSAEYEKMKEYKKQQRELKTREKANPSSRAQGFWEREASRSGLAGTGAMISAPIRATMGKKGEAK